jgi:hypothetical protein
MLVSTVSGGSSHPVALVISDKRTGQPALRPYEGATSARESVGLVAHGALAISIGVVRSPCVECSACRATAIVAVD